MILRIILRSLLCSHLSMRTNAGMPPDLKMASKPSRWCDRLCRMLAVARAVSMSLVFCMTLTTAATIWGDPIRARRDASFCVSWFTICAALFTTTWTSGPSQRLIVLSAGTDFICNKKKTVFCSDRFFNFTQSKKTNIHLLRDW